MKRVTLTLTDDEVSALQTLWSKFGSHALLNVLPGPIKSSLAKLREALK